ncbi:MAG: CHAP domain-containing protein [Pseudonocardiaceae bacterium]|nr:MAG: CHAP domain-containing protein [Pseudonocardiaceae bacterium]
MDGVAWCNIFVWWCFTQAGASALTPKSAYTPATFDWYKSRKMTGSVPRAGALVFYDFPNDGINRISHVGFVEAVLPDGRIQTIEGNTTSGNSGDQRKGGGVYRRVRTTSAVVGYAYPAYSSNTVQTKPSAITRRTLSEGATGQDVFDLQSFMNRVFKSYSNIDLVPRRYGPQTIAVMKEFQKRTGLVQDGITGPATYAKLAKFGFK